jgi:hypothetical protein
MGTPGLYKPGKAVREARVSERRTADMQALGRDRASNLDPFSVRDGILAAGPRSTDLKSDLPIWPVCVAEAEPGALSGSTRCGFS